MQRLLLSGILPEHKQQELQDVVQALDPIGLFEHVKQLQQAVFRCAADANPFVSQTASLPLRLFAVEECTILDHEGGTYCCTRRMRVKRAV